MPLLLLVLLSKFLTSQDKYTFLDIKALKYNQHTIPLKA